MDIVVRPGNKTALVPYSKKKGCEHGTKLGMKSVLLNRVFFLKAILDAEME
jgi:hypothetical protein